MRFKGLKNIFFLLIIENKHNRYFYKSLFLLDLCNLVIKVKKTIALYKSLFLLNLYEKPILNLRHIKTYYFYFNALESV